MKIGILTSGGDAPGMNAVIRSVVRTAIAKNIKVVGIKHGYNGLVNPNILPMQRRDVSDIVQRGGTKLKTARSDEFNTKEGMLKAKEVMNDFGIDGLVVVGGDGTLRGAEDFYKTCNVPVVGIPATIDNDLAYTDYTIGFDTAANTIIAAINNIRDTMISHDRVSIVEVMGRRCGDLALYAGIAGGAEIILVPEIKFSIKKIIDQIRENRDKGKSSEIIVLAEGFCKAEDLKEEIIKEIGTKVWTTRLGHIQRGGTPSVQDRVLAARFGIRAVELLEEGKYNRCVGIKNNKIIDVDTTKALQMKRIFNKKLHSDARMISL